MRDDAPGSPGDDANGPRPPERIRLIQGGAILLESDGFRLIEPRGLKRSPLHGWDTLSHVYVTDRVLLIGTTDGLLTIRASDFIDPETGPTAARRALLDRLAREPDGRERLAELAAVDRLGERSGPPWVVWLTVVLCLIGMMLQIRFPSVEHVGAFLPELFNRGEYWRAITAHFLHDPGSVPRLLRPLLPGIDVMPFHLAMNVGGLLVLGHLVERPLGSWRTAIVLATSGLGTIAGIQLAGHAEVIGASGLVAGLAGSMLATELHYSRYLPSFWRLPRRIFIGVLALQFLVIDRLLSHYLAGGAHLGGFVAGYLATWLLGRPSVEALVPTRPLRVGSYCAATLVLVGFLGALPLARRDMPALERHAYRLLDAPSSIQYYEYDNEAAWLLATEGGASERGIALAVALADRAVVNTGRLHPGILDTLAEALFQSGDRLGAILAIDEAIRLQPWEPYFREQRRRFTGERDPDDRPPPPGTTAPDDAFLDEEWEPLLLDPDAPRVTI